MTSALVAWLLLGQASQYPASMGPAPMPHAAAQRTTSAPIASDRSRMLVAQGTASGSNSAGAARTVGEAKRGEGMAAPQSKTPPTKTSTRSPSVPEWMRDKAGQEPTVEPLNLSNVAFRMFVATIGVLAAAATSLYLGRQWLDRRQPIEPTGGRIQVLETRSVANRATLKLVDAGGQMVLVGIDSRGIQGMVTLSSSFEDVWEEAEGGFDAEPVMAGPREFHERRPRGSESRGRTGAIRPTG